MGYIRLASLVGYFRIIDRSCTNVFMYECGDFERGFMSLKKYEQMTMTRSWKRMESAARTVLAM
jgi:hypothetical protein